MKNKNFKPLTKADLKNITGGIISKETWAEMCYGGKFIEPGLTGNGSVEEQIMQEINDALCDQYA